MLLDTYGISIDDDPQGFIDLLVAQGHEGSFWDFKKIWPKNKVDLIHDVVCMANNLESNISYIICGIDEENDFRFVDVRTNNAHRKNTQQLNNMLWSQPWAFAPPLVEVVEVDMINDYVDVIVIYAESKSQPYYFTKPITNQGKTLLPGTIYTRVEDSNTPVDRTASLRDTEQLWQKRFGINLTPLERLPLLLDEHEMWAETSPHPSYAAEAFTEVYYHKKYPEFTLMKIPDDRKNGWEYYMLTSPYNDSADWYLVRLYYHNTMLVETLGVYIDHHFFPIPRLGVITNKNEKSLTERKHYYYFYIEGALEDLLEQFYLGKEETDEYYTHQLIMEVVPRYKSEKERVEFEEYLKNNQEVVLRKKDAVEVYIGNPVFPDSYREDCREVFKDQAKYGCALVKILNEFRERTQF